MKYKLDMISDKIMGNSGVMANYKWQVVIHFNGWGYCYSDITGKQLSKYYSTIGRLRKWGKINI